MNKEEEICIKCGKYLAEDCFTFCEFCLGVSDKDDYIKQLQNQLDIANSKLKEAREYCEVNIDDKFDVFLSNKLRKILSIIGGNDE